jgi:drug/metabolite transporter (DMT)-like permease/quercetin dioxygenase-like cupin family protein
MDTALAAIPHPNQASASGKKQLAGLLLPLAFVVLYGSGFVGAKYGLPYCPPLTFLAIRFAVAAALVSVIAVCLRASWPASLREAAHIAVAGLLTVATFSAGTFASMYLGISPALSALIIALQPLLIAVLARRVVRENVSARQWLGLALGFLGVAFVVGNQIRFDGAHAIGVGLSVLGLIGLTAGNLYQKRFCAGMNVATGGAIQAGASALAMVVLAAAWETPAIQWTPQFLGALLYMTVGVSIGAVTLLYVMIRRGDVSRVASVFYLVPVPAAVASLFILGESLDMAVVIGVGIIAAGILLVNATSARVPTVDAVQPFRKIRVFSDEVSSGVKWSEHATQGRQGALIHEIYHCGSPLRKVALVRFTPGSSAAGHRHSSYETILVLSGSYQDDFGQHDQGELVVYPPGSTHSWSSPTGATLFVVWDAPTEKLDDHAHAA